MNNLVVRFLGKSVGFDGEEGWYFGTPGESLKNYYVGPYATRDEALSDMPTTIQSSVNENGLGGTG